MKRLFVDIDGTLVTWGKGEARDDFGEPYEVNTFVYYYLASWSRENPDGTIVIWSGGGKDYALTWAKRILPTHMPWVAHAKQPITVIEGQDEFIDDEPWKVWAHLSRTPQQIEAMLRGEVNA